MKYVIASSVSEAIRELAEAEGTAMIMAGGTDLVLDAQSGKKPAEVFVDITRIPGMGDPGRAEPDRHRRSCYVDGDCPFAVGRPVLSILGPRLQNRRFSADSEYCNAGGQCGQRPAGSGWSHGFGAVGARVCGGRRRGNQNSLYGRNVRGIWPQCHRLPPGVGDKGPDSYSSEE